jgi:hypothetical protein
MAKNMDIKVDKNLTIKNQYKLDERENTNQ